MDLNLAGRKVLITGAGDGIGRELALAFGKEGARVAGCARTTERLQALEKEIEGADHMFQYADVTQKDDLERFFWFAVEQLDGLDVLINNVGSIGKMAHFFDLTDDDWQAAFDINLLPAVRLCRLAVPELKKSKHPCILNISSIAGNHPGEVFPHYAAMKAGLSNLTVSLAQTLAADGIRVNTVAPGPVWTRSWQQEAEAAAKEEGTHVEEMAEAIRQSTADTVPLKRIGMPADVTGLTLFLASEQASWITGTHFTIDGGIVRNPF
ncbi:SDR family NAD(P)-dependent oxidoreductase [Nitrospina watsonii]|uniref:3-oxoacyl-(Acyl-carrier-protein) reductase n=1 Tax=Nitrospina watsonii TaxID=1323948 RepID=A0ABM9HAP5_9BACT|nr:SDR family oxidoreductase [Nitrospina watsonii]CAI2717229.1 Putative 3-oxoacyl-(Acyl-carrier-protein) reductase [Nitrospina watsonii]